MFRDLVRFVLLPALIVLIAVLVYLTLSSGFIGPRSDERLIQDLEKGSANARRSACYQIPAKYKNMDEERKKKVLEILCMRALKDDSEYVRSAACASLGLIEEKSTVDTLQKCLKDVNSEVRRNAVWALGNIASPDSLEDIKSLLNDHDYYVRINTAFALVRLKDSSGVQLIRDLLKNGDRTSKKEAIKAVVVLRDIESIGVLEELSQDKDEEISKLAKLALEEFKKN